MSKHSQATSRHAMTALVNSRTLWAGASVAVLLAAAPQLAVAQEAGLQEVVVTANRVAGSAQRTSIAMEVIGSEELKAQGITSVTALSAVSPSVNVTGFGGGTVVTIRGISSRDTTEIGDPAVVVSVDGFYNDRSYALGLAQYDLQRIEVLRGPQGTLYGRNATGGAINIYSTRPGKEFGGYVQVEAGTYDLLNTEGAVNLPVNDKIQTRLSFGTNYRTGFRTGFPYNNSDDSNSRSGRFQIAAQPIENLELNFLAQHTVQTSNGNSAQTAPYQITSTGLVRHDFIPSLSDKRLDKAENSRLNLNDSAYKWSAVYTTPFATVTYLGGYNRLKWNNLAPAYNYSQPQTATITNPARVVQVYNQRERPVTTNHEFRLTSPDQDARLTWQAGVFYFQNHNLLDSYNYTPNGTLTPIPVIHFQYDVKLKSLAEMAQVGFKVTDTFKITVGARHNKDEKFRLGYLFNAAARPAGLAPTILNTTVKKNTYHLGADWQITPANLLYAKYDTGYKSGGFTDIAAYGPEEVETWEIGAKNRFLDNTVQFNVDAYQSDYTGQQVSQIVQNGGGQRIVNAGATRLRGIEGEVTAAMPYGRFELNAAYLDAKFTDFTLAVGELSWNGTSYVTVTSNKQLRGNRPQQAPKWSLGAAYEYTFNGVFGGSLTPRIQTKYQTKQYYTFFNRPDDTQKSNAITNAYVTYSPEEGSWNVQAYVLNLTDESVFSNAGPNDRGRNYSYTYQPPRTAGARINYKW